MMHRKDESMNKKEALAKIEENLDAARKLLNDSAEVANEAGVSFKFWGRHYFSPIPHELKKRHEEIKKKWVAADYVNDVLTDEENKILDEFEFGEYERPEPFFEEGYDSTYSGWWTPSSC